MILKEFLFNSSFVLSVEKEWIIGKEYSAHKKMAKLFIDKKMQSVNRSDIVKWMKIWFQRRKKKLTGIAAQTSKSNIPSSEHSMVVPSTAFKSCINGGRGGGGKWNLGGGPGPSHASSPQSKKSLSNIFHIKIIENYSWSVDKMATDLISNLV